MHASFQIRFLVTHVIMDKILPTVFKTNCYLRMQMQESSVLLRSSVLQFKMLDWSVSCIVPFEFLNYHACFSTLLCICIGPETSEQNACETLPDTEGSI